MWQLFTNGIIGGEELFQYLTENHLIGKEASNILDVESHFAEENVVYVPSRYSVIFTRKFQITMLMFFLICLLYYIMHLEPVPITGRKHMVDIDRQQELELGKAAYKEVLQAYRGHVLPPYHPVCSFGNIQ